MCSKATESKLLFHNMRVKISYPGIPVEGYWQKHDMQIASKTSTRKTTKCII